MVKQDDTDEAMVKQEGADMIVKKENDNADDRNLDLPSIDDIKGHMCRESWVTETKVPNVVRITHWGVGAAKRAGSRGGTRTRRAGAAPRRGGTRA